MAAKKKPECQIPPEGTDLLVIKPLGAGQEVGRSCIMLEFKGKKIMLDCGIHPGLSGIESLPFIDKIDASEIDLLLISHFHLDHCGALPWFLLKTSFKGRCFMTHATMAIYQYLLSDCIKVNKMRTEILLYSEADLEDSLEKIETIDFLEEKEVSGIRFWCYNAGHVLGAAMFMLDIDGVKIMYTGDFSRQEDRHLMAAEIPNLRPHVLIIESTHGTRILEERNKREARLTSLVHDIINRGGKCLIPVAALGTAQELMLILNEYWLNNPELHEIPIYYGSTLAWKCVEVYKTYINAMNWKIRRQIAINNPFDCKYILNLKDQTHSDDTKPCVIMATSGMMQSGLSRELFERWCTDSKNGVIITGYCVEGTLAKEILSEPEDISVMDGQILPLKMSVDNISFSAHADYQQTSEFIRILKPPHIVLVHGEQNEMERLKTEIIREYEDDSDVDIEVYSPRNAQSVELYFRGEKITQVMGSLTVRPPMAGLPLSGVLVKRNFSYHLLAPSDLSKYTEMVMSTVRQRLSVPYSGTLQVLHFHLSQISRDAKLIIDYQKFGERKILQVFDAIIVFQEEKVIILEWTASPLNDMYADAVVVAILKAEKSKITLKTIPPILKVDMRHFTKCLMETLAKTFGEDAVSEIVCGEKIIVTVNEKCAEINVLTLEVKCADDELLQQMLSTSVSKLYNCLIPQKT